MYLTKVAIEGFADLPSTQIQGLKRHARIAGPGAPSGALGDALQLFFGVFDPPLMIDLLRRWGAIAGPDDVEFQGEPILTQASWSDRHGARWVAGGDRTLSVDLSLQLDPALYGELRTAAAHVTGLGSALVEGGGRVDLGVRALFSQTHDVLALSLAPLGLGEARYPLAPGERPDWATRLLRVLAGRFVRHDPFAPVAADLARALGDRADHGAYVRWQGCLSPHALRVAQGLAGPCILADERPLARLGPAAQARVRLAHSVYLSGADILWADSVDPWLGGAVQGDGSPLEQVFQVGAHDDAHPLEPAAVGDAEGPPVDAPLPFGPPR